ncbi:WD repeat-containing protein 53 [Pseudorasbora parva]|uniref:WD repeat-containing protein 53 n=1 Tax=Pseudorasbora parva TaxID=51549 RepID=UPI00351F3439
MSRVWSGGHSSAVLCAAVSGPSQLMVASGAEAGELTLWSPDGSPLSSLRLSSEPVTGLAFCAAAPERLYASHGRDVSVLDCRKMSAPLATLPEVAEEEINGLSVDESGRTLATADDSGAVTLIDLQLLRVSRTLSAHHNICSSVAFRPRRPQSLVSAGLDMQVCLWNLPKPRPLWSCSLQEQEASAEMINPPLAHCVCVSSCGTVLGCAAEDGAVHLLRVSEDGRLRQRGSLRAHSQGASQAHFLSFLSHPYWLASGGNDGLLALWDLSREPLVAHGRKPRGQRRRAGARQSVPSQEEQEELRPTQCFQHGEKVNWLCPAVLEGKPSLLVTDQTSCLSVYSLERL